MLGNSRNTGHHDDRFTVPADVPGVLPCLQATAGPHTIPTPLAAELRRTGRDAAAGLRPQPSQRLGFIEGTGRNRLDHY